MRIFKYVKKDKQWTQFDNLIFTIDRAELADGAKVLYGFLAGWKNNGAAMTSSYIMKCLSISEPTYNKYVRQLKALDLILIERKSPRNYVCYVGNTDLGASFVKKFWRELDDNDSTGPITKSQLDAMRHNRV